VAATLLLAAVAALLLMRLPAITRDDAYISYRYAWNLVHGHGLTWNRNQAPVEGYSNLLWTLWVALGIQLGVVAATWAKVWGVACFVGAALAAGAAVITMGASRWAAVAAVLLCGSSSIAASWSEGGLEGPLLAFLLTAGLWRALAERQAADRGESGIHWSVPLFGLAAITHVEGPLYLGIPVLLRLIDARHRPLGWADARRLAWLCAPAAAQLLLRLGYYGDPLPNTLHAKGLGAEDPLRIIGLRYLLAGLTSDPYQAVIWLGGGALALATGRGALLLPAAATCFFILVANGDTFSGFRFLAPGVPSLVAAGIAGLDVAAQRIGARSLRLTARLLILALVVGTIATELRPGRTSLSVHPKQLAGQLHQDPDRTLSESLTLLAPPWATVAPRPWSLLAESLRAQKPEAIPWFLAWLIENLPEGASFYFEDVGVVGYALTQHDLLDGRGLNWAAAARLRTQSDGGDPRVARFKAEFFAADPLAVLLPCDNSITLNEGMRHIVADPRFRAAYRMVAQGPYFGTGQVCLIVKGWPQPLDPAVAIWRYERLERMLPGAYDWDRRRVALAQGVAANSEAPYVTGTLPAILR
jgi:hypothetical protein